jgi:hypothetical protein
MKKGSFHIHFVDVKIMLCGKGHEDAQGLLLDYWGKNLLPCKVFESVSMSYKPGFGAKVPSWVSSCLFLENPTRRNYLFVRRPSNPGECVVMFYGIQFTYHRGFPGGGVGASERFGIIGGDDTPRRKFDRSRLR